MSVFGLVAEALARRRDRGVASPTIVSCDNIEGNGDVARQAFTTYAERVHPGLAEWIRTNTRFPNSMVDRITPVTTPDVIAALKDEFGVEDQWPVVAEPFTSWVLEDDFSDGRPPLEDVDVLLVDDVTPYELMKLRLLNASHQSLCYFAYLGGYRLVHDAAGDPLFAEFLMRYMDTEATPTLLPVPGIDLPDYKRTLIETVRQPRRARHHRPAVLRLVGPHPEVVASGGPREPGRRRPGPAVGGDGGQLGALRRGRRRAGRADRRPGPAGRHAGSAGPLTTRQSDGVHRKHRGVRGSRHLCPIRRGVPMGAGLTAPRRRDGRRWRALMRKESA